MDQQTRDGTIQLVEVQEPVARGGRVRAAPAPPLATPGVFDIKWVGAVGSEGPPILGHAAADSSLYTYLLEGSEQGPGDEQGGGAAAADSASRPRLTPLASVDCTAEGGTAGSSLSLSLDWNDRGVSMPEPIAAVSMSDGTVCLCQLGEGLIKVTQWKAHDLEAWIASFNPREPHMLFTGADDRKFKCWDTRTECVAATMTNARAHEAGVCSIQCDPHSEFTIATGSYDEQVTHPCRPSLQHVDLRGACHPELTPSNRIHTGAHLGPSAAQESSCPDECRRRCVAAKVAPDRTWAFTMRRNAPRIYSPSLCAGRPL